MEAVLERIRAAAEERGLEWLVQLSTQGLIAGEGTTSRSADMRNAATQDMTAGSVQPSGSIPMEGRSSAKGAGPAAAAPAGHTKELRPRRARAPERFSPEHGPSRGKRRRSGSPAPPHNTLPLATPTGRGSKAGRTPARQRRTAGSEESRAERGTGPTASRQAKSRRRVGGGAAGQEQPCSESGAQRPGTSTGQTAGRNEASAGPAERSQHSGGQEESRSGGPAAGGPTALTRPDEHPALVWILGHSYVFWGAERAGARPNGRQLRFPNSEARIKWMGIRGMSWGAVLEEVERRVRGDRAPDVLVIHAGGNDLGKRRFRDLSRDIRYDFLRLQESYPGIVVVWSKLVPRKLWRGARSEKGLNRARVKLNKEVSRFVGGKGGIAVRHIDLEKGTGNYWRSDGVHLNDIGMDLWMEGLQEGIERALAVWRAAQAQEGRASLAVAGDGEGTLEPV
ncbi:uncharacterized protein [Eleutherodactylus coqui]|uniref:uncharacterized protein n=1 Tax=Eleutherodactylus coqui TaxID=57060 RepID=UPI00346293E1